MTHPARKSSRKRTPTDRYAATERQISKKDKTKKNNKRKEQMAVETMARMKSRKKSKIEPKITTEELLSKKEYHKYKSIFVNPPTYSPCHPIIGAFRSVIFMTQTIEDRKMKVDDIKDDKVRQLLQKYDPHLFLYDRYYYIVSFWEIGQCYEVTNRVLQKCNYSYTTYQRYLNELYGCLKIISEKKNMNYLDANIRKFQFSKNCTRINCMGILNGDKGATNSEAWEYPSNKHKVTHIKSIYTKSASDMVKMVKLPDKIKDKEHPLWESLYQDIDDGLFNTPEEALGSKQLDISEAVSGLTRSGVMGIFAIARNPNIPTNVLKWLGKRILNVAAANGDEGKEILNTSKEFPMNFRQFSADYSHYHNIEESDCDEPTKETKDEVEIEVINSDDSEDEKEEEGDEGDKVDDKDEGGRNREEPGDEDEGDNDSDNTPVVQCLKGRKKEDGKEVIPTSKGKRGNPAIPTSARNKETGGNDVIPTTTDNDGNHSIPKPNSKSGNRPIPKGKREVTEEEEDDDEDSSDFDAGLEADLEEARSELEGSDNQYGLDGLSEERINRMINRYQIKRYHAVGTILEIHEIIGTIDDSPLLNYIEKYSGYTVVDQVPMVVYGDEIFKKYCGNNDSPQLRKRAAQVMEKCRDRYDHANDSQ